MLYVIIGSILISITLLITFLDSKYFSISIFILILGELIYYYGAYKRTEQEILEDIKHHKYEIVYKEIHKDSVYIVTDSIVKIKYIR